MPERLYKLNKSPQDIDALLAIHKNLVYYMLTQLRQLGNPDAESAAWEALWRAIETFDIFSDTAFSTYACKLIRNAILCVLRSERAKKNQQHVYTDNIDTECFGVIDEYMVADLYKQFDILFGEYIKTKTGITRNVLLAWYSSRFNTSISNLAIMCNCSNSYVSRILTTFRAYLSSKLQA